jgi:NDP-sugar pyrophosphorylase family protein
VPFMSREKPKVLLPLVNVPMLDLTLEFLSLNGVQEVPQITCVIFFFAELKR